MPAIFNRQDDTIIEILPKYPDALNMSGRYVIDYPDNFDLKMTTTPTRAEIINKVNELMVEKYVSFDYFVTNNLLTEAHFTDTFETDPNVQISLVNNQYLPVHPVTNPEYNFKNAFKNGDSPNTTQVYGRFPQKHHLTGATLTTDSTALGNRCLVTKEIDISGTTSNASGRTDFFLYFRSALKSYVKDSTLSNVDRGVASPLTSNQAGVMSYTNTQYDSPHRLRCFISSDGSTYSEIENLKVFSFSQKVDSIWLAFVNYTDADLTLLSYTLMY